MQGTIVVKGSDGTRRVPCKRTAKRFKVELFPPFLTYFDQQGFLLNYAAWRWYGRVLPESFKPNK